MARKPRLIHTSIQARHLRVRIAKASSSSLAQTLTAEKPHALLPNLTHDDCAFARLADEIKRIRDCHASIS
jgi:hypothetical protein